MENDAKGDMQSHVWSKMATWAFWVRLIVWFLTLWCDANKSLFYEVTSISKQNAAKHARKHHCRQRVCTYAGRGPWGGHARDRKEEKGEKDRRQLESLKGKVEILESFKVSSTPEGQRPGEFENFEKNRKHTLFFFGPFSKLRACSVSVAIGRKFDAVFQLFS